MQRFWWHKNGAPIGVLSDNDDRDKIMDLDRSSFVVKNGDCIFLTDEGEISASSKDHALPCLGVLPAITPNRFGDAGFRRDYGTTHCYMAGAMAQGISSPTMVKALGKSGYLGSFGSGGLTLSEIEKAIVEIKAALPEGPYAFNLLSSPYYPGYERAIVDIYVKHGVRIVEAAAFITPSPALAYYRLSGLKKDENGAWSAGNHVIAKISRREVAERFMEPVPEPMIRQLRESGLISEDQALAAAKIPLADDVTVEADSAGHTDNRPLVSLLPAILSTRDIICRKYAYPRKIRVGAAGGISTASSALAAFSMGADYVVTGSINQSCVEANTSGHTRKLLTEAGMADVMMAPAADMFEMGARVQVLKKGTMFPLVSQKLYDLYHQYGSIDELPPEDKTRLETKIFKKDMAAIWQETVAYFQERDPRIIDQAAQHPKKKMALIFKWYLGRSSQWAISGDPQRCMDAQIWCGQAMGSFNDWVAGTPFTKAENRNVADLANIIMYGAALLCRINTLNMLGYPEDRTRSLANPQQYLALARSTHKSMEVLS